MSVSIVTTNDVQTVTTFDFLRCSKTASSSCGKLPSGVEVLLPNRSSVMTFPCWLSKSVMGSSPDAGHTASCQPLQNVTPTGSFVRGGTVCFFLSDSRVAAGDCFSPRGWCNLLFDDKYYKRHASPCCCSFHDGTPVSPSPLLVPSPLSITSHQSQDATTEI
jgi:hypothetical protein